MEESIQTEEKALAFIIATYGKKGYSLVQKAEAFAFLYRLYGSVNEVSRITGIDNSSVNRYLRIIELPEEVKELVSTGKICSYHVASELTRIQDGERLFQTAKIMVGVPREIGREIIRYVLKHPDISIVSCAKTVLEGYKNELNLHILILDLNDLFNEKIIDKINDLDISIFEKNVKDMLHLEHKIFIKLENRILIIIMDKEQIKYIKQRIKPRKNILKIIEEAVNSVVTKSF